MAAVLRKAEKMEEVRTLIDLFLESLLAFVSACVGTGPRDHNPHADVGRVASSDGGHLEHSGRDLGYHVSAVAGRLACRCSTKHGDVFVVVDGSRGVGGEVLCPVDDVRIVNDPAAVLLT